MRKNVIICAVCVACLFVTDRAEANPVKKSIQTGGYTREYLVYTPQHPVSAPPHGLLVMLHGFNKSMESFFDEYDFRSIADSLNYIILSPQALPEQSESVKLKADILNLLMGDKLKLDAVWACGLRVKATLGILTLLDDVLNKDVNDVDFLQYIIRQTLSDYDLPPDNIFIIGTSMGGFMAYQYALLQPVKIAGMVSVAGSMGLDVKQLSDKSGIKTPVCDFHSVTDEVVPYTGSFQQSGVTVTLAQRKEQVIQGWVNLNQCGAPSTENVNYYPSTNGITVEKITYPSTSNEVIHYKINGAPHNYFFKKENGDCMDYREEIAKFIAAHASSSPVGITCPQQPDIKVYPNPARDVVYFGVETGRLTIYNLTGQTVWTGEFNAASMNISFLKSGIYIFYIQAEGKQQAVKIMINK